MPLRDSFARRRHLHAFVLVVLLALIIPATANASSSERVVSVPDAAWHSGHVVGVDAPFGIGVVGVTWSGRPATLQLRSRRGATSHWTAWHEIDVSQGAEAGAKLWGTEIPVWVARADQVQVRATRGAPRGAKVTMLAAGVTSRDRVVARRIGRLDHARHSTLEAGAPPIHLRAEWGADESIRRANPIYAATLLGAVVHHTDGSNAYAPADVPAIIRGIYRFHVVSRGWNDIGYDYLIDRFGGVWEGRGGGIAANVVGAHTGGFNTGTTGIALIGTFTSSDITPEARAALVQLLSWRLDIAHVDPTAQVTLTSGGNEKYAAGRKVTVRTVSGHRDLSSTSCPGTLLYPQLTQLAAAAWVAGGAKVAAPRATVTKAADGTVASVAFSAAANQDVAFTLDVRRTSDGAPLARLTAAGTSLGVTWDASAAGLPVAPTDVSWHLAATTATSAALPFDGPLVGTAAASTKLAVSFAAHPGSFLAPNGDGLLDTLPLDLQLSVGAQVQVTAAPTAAPSATRLLVRAPGYRPPGRSTITLDGSVADGSALPDGAWTLHVSASAATQAPVEVVWNIIVDRGIAYGPLPPGISPNGDRRLESAPINVATVDPARPVTVELLSAKNRVVATLHTGPLAGGVLRLGGRVGRLKVTDGRWRVRVSTPSIAGTTLQLVRTIRVDRSAPRARAVRRKRVLSLRVSEPVLASAHVRGHHTRYLRLRKGATTTRAFGSARTILLRDDAGNRTTVKVG